MGDVNERIDEGEGESDYFSIASATRSFSGLSDNAGGNWTPRALPDAPNADRRPVWEPPILDYPLLIGEEHEKKREAVLEHTGGDVAKTTDIMDVDTEEWLLAEYCRWAGDTARSAMDNESREFFIGLRKEVFQDWGDVWDEWRDREDGIEIVRNEDGTYRIFDWQSDDDFELEDEPVSDVPANKNTLDNRAGCSITRSSPSTSQSHNIHNSAPADGEEELSWLDSVHAFASTSGQPTVSARTRDAAPLALRLISLQSKTTCQNFQLKQKETTEDDDVD